MEALGAAIRAGAERLDLRMGKSGCDELALVVGSQIEMAGGVHSELASYFVAYFVAADGDSRPNCGKHVLRPRAERFLHFA